MFISGFDFTTVWGLHDFIWFFLSGIGWSRIFVLKGEIEREMGRENYRGGVLASFLRSFSLKQPR